MYCWVAAPPAKRRRDRLVEAAPAAGFLGAPEKELEAAVLQRGLVCLGDVERRALLVDAVDREREPPVGDLLAKTFPGGPGGNGEPVRRPLLVVDHRCAGEPAARPRRVGHAADLSLRCRRSGKRQRDRQRRQGRAQRYADFGV